MSLRIPDQNPSEMDTANFSAASMAANLKSGSAQAGTSTSQSANANYNALNATQDTASINSAATQLSSDLPIRQDRVDALRAQIESGTYTVNAHAVANAMFQNLFRS